MTIRLPLAALGASLAFLVAGCGGSSEPACVPSAEVCDGVDNNCDGRIDEGFDVGAACTAGVGACQRTGVKVCAPGGATTVCNAVAGSPTAETCNGIDDDCDGQVDQGVPDCCTPSDTRPCGTTVGVCVAGTQTCSPARAWGSCLDGQGQPVVLPGQRTEACNGLDDNCDGQVDEGFDVGAACSAGVGACRASGVKVCSQDGTATVCDAVPGSPSPEVCNGIDDDCNGAIDDGLGTISCGTGACTATVPACVNGVPGTCIPGTGTPEVCNGVDDDCNGAIDDGLGTITCGVGACQRTVAACANGVPGTCVPGSPTPELCNGVDDDCNGVVDTDAFPDLGTACTVGIGACLRWGVKICKADHTGTFCGGATPGTPTPEVCDGIDNDCNGAVDDGNPGGGTACTTGLLGVCSPGTTVCQSGSITCRQNVFPSSEVCDGLDNDCNGVVDEGDPGGGAACTTGLPGVCSAGTRHCQGGVLTCVQNVLPSAEVCDGLDNNCNATVDEGDPGGGAACSTGLLGVCSPGTRHCQTGALTCVQNVSPSAEVCDGLDNNCNGQIDEGNPGGGVACTTGKLGVCAAGVTQCQNGALVCVQSVAPSAEVCDGLDNNCDGQVDEGDPGGGAACTTGLQGVCAPGTIHCQGGVLRCVQNVAPYAELCDGLDNDCNGMVDDGFNLGASCSVGVGACQRSGVIMCAGPTGAACSAVPGTPTPELCNGIDDDCNGQVDDAPVATICPLTDHVDATACSGAGGCAVLTCQPGWFDRNGIYSDGCESSI